MKGQRETKPPVYIIVNGRERAIPRTTITYDEAAACAYTEYERAQGLLFTITYRNGPMQNPTGSLTPAKSAHISNGMVFCVAITSGA